MKKFIYILSLSVVSACVGQEDQDCFQVVFSNLIQSVLNSDLNTFQDQWLPTTERTKMAKALDVKLAEIPPLPRKSIRSLYGILKEHMHLFEMASGRLSGEGAWEATKSAKYQYSDGISFNWKIKGKLEVDILIDDAVLMEKELYLLDSVSQLTIKDIAKNKEQFFMMAKDGALKISE